jgi:tetratricopeptide (TPR) repeat protein
MPVLAEIARGFFCAMRTQLHNSDCLQRHTIDIADAGLGEDTMLRIVAATSLVLVSWAVLADDKGDCQDSKDHDLRIKDCSAIILRNPKDVVAYHNRGDAYGLKGDIDRAISDYNKAIELNPNYAPAYNSRGRAYTSKGDYTRAVADVTKAGELTPKLVPKPGPLSKGAAHKSNTPKPGLVARKPGLLPPAGMVAPQKSTVAKSPKQEALQTAGKAAPHKSNDQPQAGVAVSGKAPAAEPAWAQSELKNSHGGF